MGHRMASDLEAEGIQLAHLSCAEISGSAEEASCEVESGAKAEFLQDWSCGNQIGFTTVVECNTDAALGRIKQSVAHTQAANARTLQPLHLVAEVFERQNVAHVARLGLDQLPARKFEFVIHQEDDTRESHWIVRNSRAAARLQRVLSSPAGCVCRSSISSRGARRNGPPPSNPDNNGFF